MNTRIQSLSESVTLQIGDHVRSMEAKGRRIVRLQTGDPDFATHPVVVESAYHALRAGDTHYANTRGLIDLRSAIATRLVNRYGRDVDPEREVLVTHGGVHAVMIAIQALVNPGDEVLVEDPCWMPYIGSTALAGGTVRRFATARNFRFSPENLEKAITPRSRVLVINSPCNPTGRVLRRDELKVISRLAVQHNLWVVSDEVYDALVYDGYTHISAATIDGLSDRTITVGSFSKTFAMTGWRVGFVTGPAAVVDEMLKVSQYTITNVAPFVQRAAVTALTHPEAAQYESFMRTAYADRRARIQQQCEILPGLRASAPEGAFYFMIDVAESGLDSSRFAMAFLEKYQVAVVPGIAFGAAADSFVRVTFAAPLENVMDGLQKMSAFMTKAALA